MAKLKTCPPAGVTPPTGWYIRRGRYGCVLTDRRPRPRSDLGLRAWSKPAKWLFGNSLWQIDRAAMRAIAHAWKTDPIVNQSAWNTAAASSPYTNIRFSYGTRNGFSLYVHHVNFFQLQNIYGQYRAGTRLQFITSFNPFPNFYETSYPVPQITDATFNSNGTWSITVPNWSNFWIYYEVFYLYVSAPGQTLIPWHTPFKVQPVTSDWANSGLFNDNGDGLAAEALKPFPRGSQILIGLRGGQAQADFIPGPLVAVGITVT